MTYNEIISEVAKNMNCTKAFVDNVYKEYWRAVRDYIESRPLKEDLTDEEFEATRPNVNIPSLGKFFITTDRYRYLKDRHKRIQEELKKQENHDKHQED